MMIRMRASENNFGHAEIYAFQHEATGGQLISRSSHGKVM
jgi:hypothetical protein